MLETVERVDGYRNWRKGLALVVGLLLIGWGLGLGTGWRLWQEAPVVHVTPKPQEVKPDGTVLAVQPAHDLKPLHALPPGSHVESTVSVTVQPLASLPAVPQVSPGDGSGSLLTVPATPCPPVTVDLTVYREADGSKRVEVSSPDGRVLKGIHLESEVGPPAPKELRWAAGLVCGTTAWGDRAVGVFVDRDLKFLRTGVELTKNTYALADRQGWEVRAKVGLRF